MIGLLELLDIQRKALPQGTQDATEFVCEEWEAHGRPTDVRPLEEFLDQVLDDCMARELYFPKVFLLRLGQLRRRQWEPEWAKCMKAMRPPT
jgi:hypothetical protein